MTELHDIKAAKRQLSQAEENLNKATKEGIVSGLLEAFGNPEVTSVAFGVATAPYNDENSGQGTFGPVVNFIQHDDDISFEDAVENYEFTHDEEYALFYDRPPADPKARLLGQVLAEAGWEAAANALGVSYWPDEGHGQDMAFIATRTTDGSFELEEYQVGEH